MRGGIRQPPYPVKTDGIPRSFAHVDSVEFEPFEGDGIVEAYLPNGPDGMDVRFDGGGRFHTITAHTVVGAVKTGKSSSYVAYTCGRTHTSYVRGNAQARETCLMTPRRCAHGLDVDSTSGASRFFSSVC